MRPDESRTIAAVMRLHPPVGFDYPEMLHILVWERAHQGLGGFLVFSTRRGASHSAPRSPLCIQALWVASYLPRADIEQNLLDAAAEYHTSGIPSTAGSTKSHVRWRPDEQTSGRLAALAVSA